MCCFSRTYNVTVNCPPRFGCCGFGMPMMPIWGFGCCSGPKNFASGLGFGLGMGLAGSIFRFF